MYYITPNDVDVAFYELHQPFIPQVHFLLKHTVYFPFCLTNAHTNVVSIHTERCFSMTLRNIVKYFLGKPFY